MVAEPAAIPLIKPVVLTVATEVLLLLYVTFWFVAFTGAIVLVNCCVEATAKVAVVGERVTPVTETVGATAVDETIAQLKYSHSLGAVLVQVKPDDAPFSDDTYKLLYPLIVYIFPEKLFKINF